MNPTALIDSTLVAEVKQLIQSAKQRAVVAVNAVLTLLYWQVGKRFAEIFPEPEIVSALRRQLNWTHFRMTA